MSDCPDFSPCKALVSFRMMPQALAVMLRHKACIASLTCISVHRQQRAKDSDILAIQLCYLCKPKMYFQPHVICTGSVSHHDCHVFSKAYNLLVINLATAPKAIYIAIILLVNLGVVVWASVPLALIVS